MAARQLSDYNSEGTVLGHAAADKIAFHGATPVVQQTIGATVATTGATNSSPYGFTGAAQADAIVTRLNQVITALRNYGLGA
jgi:hypothetical protein